LAVTSAIGMRYVARQPILDWRGRVHGYELLFRSGPASLAFSEDGEAATRTVLDSSVVFGMERLTGGLPMFVNCTREALIDGLVKVLPPAHTVLELLETLEPDAALVKACRELKKQGYRLALDDFIWKPSWQPLFEIADYVKVEMSMTTPSQRAELKQRIGRRPTRLVMEQVETLADWEQASKEGFTLFQGYYFCRPTLIENRDIPPNRLAQLEILAATLEYPLDVIRMSALVKRDPSLTYRLLRMVNSPLYATHKAINSIKDALMLIGDAMFRRMAMLAIACELKGNQPSELLRMAFLRGRFCELAAAATGQDATEQYLIGILSLLPAMMGLPMDVIVAALPLRDELREALRGYNNDERAVLELLISHESANWGRCDDLASAAGLQLESLPQFYAEAAQWAEKNIALAAG
jgi:EAL and modified HD-GYP domain-containing signal transduction protein